MADVSLTSGVARSRPAAASTAREAFWRGGLTAMLYLAGSLPVVFAVAFLLSRLPYHLDLFEAPLIGVALLMSVLAGGGWLWGRSLARLAAAPRPTLLAGVAAGSFVFAAFSAAFALGVAERYFVEAGGAGRTPIYIIFGILFTLASFYMVAVVGTALGLALRARRLALELALRGGLAGAGAFLAADVVQHLFGRVVGGPNAEATLTMLSVMMLGQAAAALAGGGVIAVGIWKASPAVPQ